MFFWLTTALRYVVAIITALLLSIAISSAATIIFAGGSDDLGVGFLGFLILVVIAGLTVPLFLGITAEYIQRRASVRPFVWSRALARSLMALPISAGPIYTVLSVMNLRPTHWAEKQVLLYGLSAVFAYVALRIRRQPGPVQ